MQHSACKFSLAKQKTRKILLGQIMLYYLSIWYPKSANCHLKQRNLYSEFSCVFIVYLAEKYVQLQRQEIFYIEVQEVFKMKQIINFIIMNVIGKEQIKEDQYFYVTYLIAFILISSIFLDYSSLRIKCGAFKDVPNFVQCQ